MRTKVCKNGMILCIIFLLIGVSMVPITSSMEVVREKNNQGVANFQKLNISDTLFGRFIYKDFFIGRIYNLTINKDVYYGNDYSFEARNLREFMHYRIDIHDWGFAYNHYGRGASFGLGGCYFRGILRPTFICGYFYQRFPYLS